ncbi:o-succinylbenzoate synthase [Halobacillus shinanisalinarum]|uniref:o-succinylbenzoate synthase n=1 Tax=Halobacillus shinanisalinarum TaxID=2932258 RepID=A0ABY4H3M9_9BACI|nr:o-succinylbenzoate synthase [Halobacillus shinanisalinarum]UOQ94202.1 o-succinylbenzoate synthase [Halobacillus shinanisalinarum]
MDISTIHLRKVSLPLRNPFKTHQGELHQRSVIIVVAKDCQGLQGYGEVTAFPSPFYTAETLETAWHMLIDIIFPIIKDEPLHHPSDFIEMTAFIQGNQMAKAGMEGALWDLYAKQNQVSLGELIGGIHSSVKAGAVLSLSHSLEKDINHLKHSGYERYKLKVEKGREKEMIEQAQAIDPGLAIMIDANGMYTEQNLDHLFSLDQLGLLMIEQPFQAGDFYLHKQAQKQMDTPLCLDESIMSLHDAKQAIKLESCRVINIKISRVGGLMTATNIHDFCQEHGIPVWCGGMVETGISKAHNIALSSLPNFTIPGDLSSSDRYFNKDLLLKPIKVENGKIDVPNGHGIGVEVDESFLEKMTYQSYLWSPK